MKTGEKIVIEKIEHGFNVIFGDKYTEQLGAGEVLDVVAKIVIEHSRSNEWLKTEAEHKKQREVWEKSKNKL